ncbi:MAG: hypothetical protein M1826_003424 [Phylliscum demangeonii]|nr:MAG: hypothetical protein M1826_003424 [Phylliscum demangeonii]
MQLRGVPEEELAIGPDGRRLPFAIITQDDRRKYVEETGPFGTSRRGRSRPKAAAAAKKEDPNLAFFEAAMNMDWRRKSENQASQRSRSRSRSTSQPTGHRFGPTAGAGSAVEGGVATSTASAAAAAAAAASSHQVKEPTEVMLYGFPPMQLHSAIQRYEAISHGAICEDYPRDPPMEFRRFRSMTSYPVPRTVSLTSEQLRKVNDYAGGESWIKVTFDSAHAADRAVAESPQLISGCWVYGELYRGMPPPRDEAIPAQAEDYPSQGLGRPRPKHRPFGGMGTSIPAAAMAMAPGATHAAISRASILPRSFTGDARESESTSTTSTASSATVTGYGLASTVASTTATDPDEFCKFIPTARKIKLRPAEEALLPTRTTAQWLASYLPFADFFNADLIGDHVPRREDGEFDYAGATIYWKFWYWVDRLMHTDFCGLKDD